MNLDKLTNRRSILGKISWVISMGMVLLGTMSSLAAEGFEKYTCYIRSDRRYISNGPVFHFYYETHAELLRHYDNSHMRRNNVGHIILRQPRVLWEQTSFTETGVLNETEESVRMSTAILRNAMLDKQSASDECYKRLNRLRASEAHSDSIN